MAAARVAAVASTARMFLENMVLVIVALRLIDGNLIVMGKKSDSFESVWSKIKMMLIYLYMRGNKEDQTALALNGRVRKEGTDFKEPLNILRGLG